MTYLNWPVGRLATQLPGATAVLFQHRINFCCLGHRLLDEVIQQHGLDEAAILASLEELSNNKEAQTDWENKDNAQLIEHLLTRYHEVHRQQLTELVRLAKRVETVHQQHPLCPRGLADFLQEMKLDLEQHMQKEEMVLFPMLSADYAPMAGGPIHVMKMEHEQHMKDIETLYKLTNDVSLHEDACNTWRALYLGLQEFISDINIHIHLENDVLFARASKH